MSEQRRQPHVLPAVDPPVFTDLPRVLVDPSSNQESCPSDADADADADVRTGSLK